MADNQFQSVVRSLMEGADGVLSSKTVVGEPITIGDTILIPLNDVTIGCGGGVSNAKSQKDSGMGGFSAKLSPSAVLIIKGGNTKVVNIKDSNTFSRLVDMIPGAIDKVIAAKNGKEMMDDGEAVELAFGRNETNENHE